MVNHWVLLRTYRSLSFKGEQHSSAFACPAAPQPLFELGVADGNAHAERAGDASSKPWCSTITAI
jgi:hypothetical protein